jgi:hypothetical protein
MRRGSLKLESDPISFEALAHDMTVVTRSTADFPPTGVAVFNPWGVGS